MKFSIITIITALLFTTTAFAKPQIVYQDINKLNWSKINRPGWESRSYSLWIDGIRAQSNISQPVSVTTPLKNVIVSFMICADFEDGSTSCGDPYEIKRGTDFNAQQLNSVNIGKVGMTDFGEFMKQYNTCTNGQFQIPCPKYNSDPRCDPEGIALLGDDLGDFSFCGV